jgi:phosphate acyltransferase
MKIVVDAMGGDFAPKNQVEGAVMAARNAPDLHIVLIGQTDKVQPLLAQTNTTDLNLTFVDAPEVIEMSDSGATAAKAKPNSSIVRGLTMCKEGNADAFVSQGNTGAVMAASLLILGRVEGVLRPCIGAYFPSLKNQVMVFDTGANLDSKPEQLVQFAEMATMFERYVLGVDAPTVGLLNIGEEDTKGTDSIKQTHKLLRDADARGRIKFIGNIEGRDVFKGDATIALCDGFVGNIVLKLGESIPDILGAFLMHALNKRVADGKLAPDSAKQFSSITKEIFHGFSDEPHGGVPLLGVNGISIIGHGNSSPVAVMNAIFAAQTMFDKRVNHHIAEMLKVDTAAEAKN